jgi:hypothetical protein
MKIFILLFGVVCLVMAGCSTDDRWNPNPDQRTYNQTTPPNAVILPTNQASQNTPPSIVAPPDNNGANPIAPPKLM